jgi:formylglycine-generating enzyme required for sulfatase activity
MSLFLAKVAMFCLFMCALLGGTLGSVRAAGVGEQEFTKGLYLLNQKQYKEARAELEVGVKKNPSNALANFYLAEACRGLKDWPCAEEHYETSLDLDAKSSVADLAKPRLRKAKAWRLLGEAKTAINDSQAPPDKIKQAHDTLDVANKLGLDDEQQAVYQQLREKSSQSQHGASANLLKQEGLTAGAGQTSGQEMPMALVPAGEFIMGSQGGAADEQPAHRVSVDTFLMDKYEVSVGQYAKFLEATSLEAPPDWNIMNQPQNLKRPVVNIDWADAAMYCKWAGKRLPTEAEWEKAARGTDGRIYPWGNEPPTQLHANFGKREWNNHAALVPVGKLEDGKSPYGIYDMAGNVWEWVNDWYDPDYYKKSPSQNPTGPSSAELKVLRGGSWSDTMDNLRSANPQIYEPMSQYHNVGFRCAKTP